jgi:hypothetical protein
MEIAAHSWDLAHVAATDRWEILEASRDENRELWAGPLSDNTGTVILWRRLDRILGFKNPYGGMAKKRLEGMCQELEVHLAMVFHRYLAGEGGRRKVRIAVNGTAVRPWDPFVRGEAGTRRLDPVTLHFNHEGAEGEILIEPYVVPHQDDFSSSEAHAAAAGPLRWNRQQGFYIYRANRMIQSGGWSNLRTLDEHTKLARVALSFEPRLDDAFRINVAKMRVQLPRQLREQIESAIGPVIKAAQATYRRSESAHHRQNTAEPQVKPVHLSVRTGRHSESADPQSPLAGAPAMPESANDSDSNRMWTIEEVFAEAERVASPEERAVLGAIFSRMRDRKHEAEAGRSNGPSFGHQINKAERHVVRTGAAP